MYLGRLPVLEEHCKVNGEREGTVWDFITDKVVIWLRNLAGRSRGEMGGIWRFNVGYKAITKEKAEGRIFARCPWHYIYPFVVSVEYVLESTRGLLGQYQIQRTLNE
jgi:hypothetical protein